MHICCHNLIVYNTLIIIFLLFFHLLLYAFRVFWTTPYSTAWHYVWMTVLFWGFLLVDLVKSLYYDCFIPHRQQVLTHIRIRGQGLDKIRQDPNVASGERLKVKGLHPGPCSVFIFACVLWRLLRLQINVVIIGLFMGKENMYWRGKLLTRCFVKIMSARGTGTCANFIL